MLYGHEHPNEHPTPVKACTGCGHLDNKEMDKKFLACCPDSRYQQAYRCTGCGAQYCEEDTIEPCCPHFQYVALTTENI